MGSEQAADEPDAVAQAASQLPAQSFPGQSEATVTVAAGEAAEVDDLTVTVLPLQTHSTPSGVLQCSTVTAVNRGSATPFLTPFTFRLQTPEGATVRATLVRPAGAEVLPTADVPGGETVSGSVCFMHRATPGQQVVLYEPFGVGERSGAWLQTL